MASDVVTELSAAAIIGLLIDFSVRKIRRNKELREFSQTHGCEEPPNESDFRYDLLGIAKAIEVVVHLYRRSFVDYTNSLFREYGETYATQVLNKRVTLTSNARNIKHILTTAFQDFDTAPLRKHLFEPITPHGIFTLDGPEWKESRDDMRGWFSNLRKIVDLNMCEEHFQAFLRHVPKEGQAFDVQTWNFPLIWDIFGSFTLGESFEALSITQPSEEKTFCEDLALIKWEITQGGFRGPFHHLYLKSDFFKSCTRAKSYVMTRAIRAAREGESARNHTGERAAENYSFMRGIGMKINEPSQLAEHAMSILIASDTMATTLTSLLFCLSRNPRVVHKLRASVIGSLGLTPPTLEQLGRLQFVRWVINEALRLFPPVPFNGRVANKDTTLPSGGGCDGQSPILIKRGDLVIFHIWARHRGEEFGERPEDFIPERWEHVNGDTASFVPFLRGPRVCPGQNHAMAALTYIVTRMFQTFSAVSNYNTQPWTEDIGISLKSHHGVMIGLS